MSNLVDEEAVKQALETNSLWFNPMGFAQAYEAAKRDKAQRSCIADREPSLTPSTLKDVYAKNRVTDAIEAQKNDNKRQAAIIKEELHRAPMPELPEISQGSFVDLDKTLFELMTKQNQLIDCIADLQRRIK